MKVKTETNIIVTLVWEDLAKLVIGEAVSKENVVVNTDLLYQYSLKRMHGDEE